MNNQRIRDAGEKTRKENNSESFHYVVRLCSVSLDNLRNLGLEGLIIIQSVIAIVKRVAQGLHHNIVKLLEHACDARFEGV